MIQTFGRLEKPKDPMLKIYLSKQRLEKIKF